MYAFGGGNSLSLDGMFSTGSVAQQTQTILVVDTAYESPESSEFIVSSFGGVITSGGGGSGGGGGFIAEMTDAILAPERGIDGLGYYVDLYRNGEFDVLTEEFTLDVHNDFAEKVYEYKKVTDDETFQTLRLFFQGVLGGLLQSTYEYQKCVTTKDRAENQEEILNDPDKLREYYNTRYAKARRLFGDMEMKLSVPFKLKPEYQAYFDAIANDPNADRSAFEGGTLDAEVLGAILAAFQKNTT